MKSGLCGYWEGKNHTLTVVMLDSFVKGMSQSSRKLMFSNCVKINIDIDGRGRKAGRKEG